MKTGQIVKDLTGKRFGRLIVVEPCEVESIGKPRKWLCKCDCGNEKEVRGTNLTYGTAKSCGCFNDEMTAARKKNIESGPLNGIHYPLTFTEFCAQHGLSAKVVRNRLKKGWTPDRALSTPVDEDIVKRNRRSRRKGRALEKYVAAELLKCFPQFDEEDIKPVASATSGIDILLSKYVRKVFPLSIECKNTVDFQYISALEQAEKNAYSDTVPCVVWKPPGIGLNGSIIYMKLDSFLNLWRNTIDEEETEEDEDITTG